jgi:hypothetical protein
VYEYFTAQDEKKFTSERPLNSSAETINGVNPKYLVLGNEGVVKNVLSPSGVIINSQNAGNTLSVVVNFSGRQFNFISTEPGYLLKTAQGIAIGSDISQLKEKYGEPAETLYVSKGSYLVYKRSKAVFLVNMNGKVSKWFLYANL